MHGGDHGARLAAIQQQATRIGIDAVLVTPGPDLRYLVGYDAVPLERLTCLVIPSVGRRPARRPPARGARRAGQPRGRTRHGHPRLG